MTFRHFEMCDKDQDQLYIEVILKLENNKKKL